jgi:hypothetical protein
MHPGVDVERPYVRPDVPHLLLTQPLDLLQVVEVLFDAEPIRRGTQDLLGTQRHVGAGKEKVSGTDEENRESEPIRRTGNRFLTPVTSACHTERGCKAGSDCTDSLRESKGLLTKTSHKPESPGRGTIVPRWRFGAGEETAIHRHISYDNSRSWR